jgi:hypothetical protein
MKKPMVARKRRGTVVHVKANACERSEQLTSEYLFLVRIGSMLRKRTLTPTLANLPSCLNALWAITKQAVMIVAQNVTQNNASPEKSAASNPPIPAHMAARPAKSAHVVKNILIR